MKNAVKLLTKISFCIVGHCNNSHCLAKAINSLAGALFTIHGPGDVEERLKEFLAVSHWDYFVQTQSLSYLVILANFMHSR